MAPLIRQHYNLATIAPPFPFRDRFTAMSVAVLVQMLFLFFALHSQTGGRRGQPFLQDGAFDEGSERIKVVLLPAEKKTDSKLSTETDKTIQSPTEIAIPPAPALTSNTPVANTATTLNHPAPASLPSQTASHLDTSARGGNTSDANTDDLYLSAVRAAIQREWQAQGGGVIPAGCGIAMDQTSGTGGAKAIRAWTVNCESLPVRERIRLETAALQAQLPYAGYESAFQPHLELTLPN